MAGTKTLTIIKPLAVELNYSGRILDMILQHGFKITAMKQLHLSMSVAGAFYVVHEGKPFFDGLVESMSTGPVVVAILEKENAVNDYRQLIGSTDPAKAAAGTIRNMFGSTVQKNAVHGTDCDDNVEFECNFFFSQLEKF